MLRAAGNVVTRNISHRDEPFVVETIQRYTCGIHPLYHVQAVRAEVEAALKLPFHIDQELVIIQSGSTAVLSFLFLAFTPGEYM